MDFYDPGGDFNNREKAKRIKALKFSADERTALVDFLRNSLTDCRVEKERAPFDHPQLPLPKRHSARRGRSGGHRPLPMS